MLAPICLFTYNRLEETKQTVEALKRNFLASESELHIFSDGPKSEKGVTKIQEVREYLKTVKGFKTINLQFSKSNKGLANSIISGVSSVINQSEKVIVLEDDLVTSPNFLDFMNQALDAYEADNEIFSISGYTMSLPSLSKIKEDFYLGYRGSSWGWATWKNRWNNVDWQVKEYVNFKENKKEQRAFRRGGSDMPRMLHNQMNGNIDSWAIRWCYYQFKTNTFTVFPKTSKLESIGFGKEATHTSNSSRFVTQRDTSNQRDFRFKKQPVLNKRLSKEFKNKFSLISRIRNRIGL